MHSPKKPLDKIFKNSYNKDVSNRYNKEGKSDIFKVCKGKLSIMFAEL